MGCCSADCQFQPTGTPCTDDGSFCTDDVCDSSGTCSHPAQPATICANAARGGARLRIANNPAGAADQLQLKWSKGPAIAASDFGSPNAGAPTYEVCVYDESAGVPSVVFDGPVPGPCGLTPCWTPAPKGWSFHSASGDPAGITRVQLVAGAAGSARLRVAAGKRALALGAFPLQVSPSVVAQVRTSDGRCWGATFSAPTRNTATAFVAASD